MSGMKSKWRRRGVFIEDERTVSIHEDAVIGKGTVVRPFTIIEQGVVIGSDCRIGPFARVRGVCNIGDGVVIGNFVEIVRSRIGRGSKVMHLAYVGDAVIGERVTLGAGTITANSNDGIKSRTVIEDNAQLGSGTILVAPVKVGKLARTGAGAVVTRGNDIPGGETFVGMPARRLAR